MKENLVCLGLSKMEEYDKVTELATSKRRKLDAEIQETAGQAAEREAKGAKQEQLKEEVKNMQAAFYCSDCRKQYKMVTEMETHFSSYDHHHTKRLRELQQQKRRVGTEKEQQTMRRKELEKEQLILQRRITAQVEAAQATTTVPVDTLKADVEKQQTSIVKVGFSFGGGVRMGSKKSTKKALAGRNVFSAFSNPLSQ